MQEKIYNIYEGRQMKRNFETCYWYYSTQCKTLKCRDCFFHYPTVKGEIAQPNFRRYKREVIDEGLHKAFVEKPSLRTTTSKQKNTFKGELSQETRELILKEITRMKKVTREGGETVQ